MKRCSMSEKGKSNSGGVVEAKREAIGFSVGVLLTSAILIINKYVLTSLGFQFPTIFLGWQTFAQFFILKIDGAILNGAKTNLAKKWRQLLHFSPSIFLHLVAIYAGSRALSRLDLHLFLVLQNFRLVLRSSLLILAAPLLNAEQRWRYWPELGSALLLFVIAAAGYSVGELDADSYDGEAYQWCGLHAAALAAGDAFSTLFVDERQEAALTGAERALLLNGVGFLFLSFGAFITGQVYAANLFPHWRLYRFYLACFLSGCLSGLSNSLEFRLNDGKSTDSDAMSPLGDKPTQETKRSWNDPVYPDWQVMAKPIVSMFSFVFLCSSASRSSPRFLLLCFVSFSAECFYLKTYFGFLKYFPKILRSLEQAWARKKGLILA